MLGGRLPETENKRMSVISGLNDGRGPLRNSSWLAKSLCNETVQSNNMNVNSML